MPNPKSELLFKFCDDITSDYIERIYKGEAQSVVDDLVRWPTAIATLMATVMGQAWHTDDSDYQDAFETALSRAALNAYPEPEDLEFKLKPGKLRTATSDKSLF